MYWNCRDWFPSKNALWFNLLFWCNHDFIKVIKDHTTQNYRKVINTTHLMLTLVYEAHNKQLMIGSWAHKVESICADFIFGHSQIILTSLKTATMSDH